MTGNPARIVVRSHASRAVGHVRAGSLRARPTCQRSGTAHVRTGRAYLRARWMRAAHRIAPDSRCAVSWLDRYLASQSRRIRYRARAIAHVARYLLTQWDRDTAYRVARLSGYARWRHPAIGDAGLLATLARYGSVYREPGTAVVVYDHEHRRNGVAIYDRHATPLSARTSPLDRITPERAAARATVRAWIVEGADLPIYARAGVRSEADRDADLRVVRKAGARWVAELADACERDPHATEWNAATSLRTLVQLSSVAVRERTRADRAARRAAAAERARDGVAQWYAEHGHNAPDAAERRRESQIQARDGAMRTAGQRAALDRSADPADRARAANRLTLAQRREDARRVTAAESVGFKILHRIQRALSGVMVIGVTPRVDKDFARADQSQIEAKRREHHVVGHSTPRALRTPLIERQRPTTGQDATI